MTSEDSNESPQKSDTEKSFTVGEHCFVLRGGKVMKDGGVKALIASFNGAAVHSSQKIEISDTEKIAKFAAIFPEQIREDIVIGIQQFEALVRNQSAGRAAPGKPDQKFICVDGVYFEETPEGYQKSTYTETGKRTTTLSGGGPLVPLIVIEQEGAEHFLMKFRNTEIFIPRAAWNSARAFKAVFGSIGFTFYGDDRDLQVILHLIAENCGGVTRKRGVSVVGLHGGVFVMPDATFDKDGRAAESPYFFRRTGNTLEGIVKIRDEKNPSELARNVCAGVLKVNEARTIIPMVGIKFAQAFAPRIRAAIGGAEGSLGHFPHLDGSGEQGAGKTTTAQLLWRMQGVDAKLFAADKSLFTQVRLLSSTNCIGIPLDEVRSDDMREDREKTLMSLLRKAYVGGIEERGNADKTITQYVLGAPIELYGETSLSSKQAALAERAVPVVFRRSALTPERQKALETLAALNLEAFPSIYLPWTLRQDVKRELATARDVLKQHCGRPIPNRVADNLTVVVFGVLMFEKFAREHNAEIAEDIGLGEAVNGCVDIIVGTGNRARNALDVFIETLAQMASRNIVALGCEYDTSIDEIWIHVPSALGELKKFARERDLRIEAFDPDAYYSIANNEREGDGYVTGVGKQKWFRGVGKDSQQVQKRAIVINRAKATSRLDLTGFGFNDGRGDL